MPKVNQLEKLPEGWKTVKLGEVIEYEQPQKYLVLNERYDKSIGIPVLTPGKSFILGYTEEQFGIYKNLPVIIFDDFTTESRYVNFPFKLKSSAIKILRNKNNENSLFFIFNAMHLLNFKPGSEHKRFWISEYSKIYIPFPQPSEQSKIAEILETVDNAIEKTDQIIEKYKRIKQGLMQDLLTKGIDENGQIRNEKTHKFKDSPLGRMPEEWEVMRLGDENKGFAELIMGQSPPSSTYNKENNGLPFLQGNADFGDIYPEPKIYTTQPMKAAERNDVLISVRAPVGELNLAPYKCCIGRGLAAVRSNPTMLDYRFAFYYFKQANHRWLSVAIGSTFGAIRKEDLSTFLVPLPPLPEQHKIAEILSQIDDTIEKEIAYKEKLQRLKSGLMEDLLTGKIRVNHLIKNLEDVKNV